MKLDKKLAIAVIATAALTTGVYGVTGANAQNAETEWKGFGHGIEHAEGSEHMYGLTQEHIDQVEAHRAERLDELQEEGTISAEQRAMLEQKHQEMTAEKERARSMDPTERRDYMQQKRDEMRQWAQENGLEMPEGARMEHGAKAHAGHSHGFGEHQAEHTAE